MHASWKWLCLAGLISAASVPVAFADISTDKDYAIKVPNGARITEIDANFTSVKPASPSIQGDDYTLQINTNYDSNFGRKNNNTLCDIYRAKSCIAWQQFTYDTNYHGQSGIYIRYWLYSPASYGVCPPGWEKLEGSYKGPDTVGDPEDICFKDSAFIKAPKLSMAKLGRIEMKARALKNKDELTIGFMGEPVAARLETTAGSVLHLSDFWTAAEFNIFGSYDAQGLPKILKFTDDGAENSTMLHVNITALTNETWGAAECVVGGVGRSNGFESSSNNLSLDPIIKNCVVTSSNNKSFSLSAREFN